ncbi:hypothetical protein AAY473_035150 [Plecturocebus cupreus]
MKKSYSGGLGARRGEGSVSRDQRCSPELLRPGRGGAPGAERVPRAATPQVEFLPGRGRCRAAFDLSRGSPAPSPALARESLTFQSGRVLWVPVRLCGCMWWGLGGGVSLGSACRAGDPGRSTFSSNSLRFLQCSMGQGMASRWDHPAVPKLGDSGSCFGLRTPPAADILTPPKQGLP